MKELNEKIIDWAKERDLDTKGTVEGQSIKTAEEIAELIKGISKDNLDLIKDSIGDVYVTLVIGNMLDKHFDLEEIYYRAVDDVDKNKVKLKEISKKLSIACLSENIIEILSCGYVEQHIETMLSNLLCVAITCNLDFKDCVESAYKEIAERKGKMINGTFVKTEDL